MVQEGGVRGCIEGGKVEAVGTHPTSPKIKTVERGEIKGGKKGNSYRGVLGGSQA